MNEGSADFEFAICEWGDGSVLLTPRFSPLRAVAQKEGLNDTPEGQQDSSPGQRSAATAALGYFHIVPPRPQSGSRRSQQTRTAEPNRFSGFCDSFQTAEAVRALHHRGITLLKPGVNESLPMLGNANRKSQI
jgi:hypothetical protein